MAGSAQNLVAERITVRGLVQGVGFRPTVWRLARRHNIRGHVANNGEGVEILACGKPEDLERFIAALKSEPPPLARVDQVSRSPIAGPMESLIGPGDFTIEESAATAIRTGVTPDAATCEDCRAEVFDPLARRFRYPFTNCTRCGPRLTIIQNIPYDRRRTTMAAFALCAECEREYRDPADRRFHAQPIACHACGPRAWIERADGGPFAVDALTPPDEVDAACSLLQQGQIVAVKGVGGFQLACDALNEEAVARLRSLKRRERKPFALMARDLDVAREYCAVGEMEAELLRSPASPIVILPANGARSVAPSVAPGVGTLGFMLPNSPLHHLLLRRMDRPVVLTSGNLSDEPQCIDNDEAKRRLGGVAEYFLTHNRPIAQRVDDSVVKVMAGEPRMLRRARGYAPAPLALPEGFDAAPRILAVGGELKNTFCLVRDCEAILSQHIGDLEDALTQEDYRHNLKLYETLYGHAPQLLACDLHPEYLSSKLARELAERSDLPLIETQHHHAHIAACMAENGAPLDSSPVIGVALDGLGFGADGELWGGEFLLADYRGFKRLASFKPVAMPGGAQAIREPWRNLYAHLMAEMGWARLAMNYAELDLFRFLESKPRHLLDRMIERGVNSPLASSCGRLFDAVAAAVGVCREHAAYEGQGAIELEAVVDETVLREEDDLLAYPFAIPRLKGSDHLYVEPLAMWRALLGDLALATPPPIIAARFHKGLAKVIAQMINQLSRHECGDAPVKTVALSGGVFQNKILLEQVTGRLARLEFNVLTHRLTPVNDGGLALGQAAIAAARSISLESM
ncbi:MAG TPA: carbamoyltransferase HypF [Blastocatellia bacterium]|nr:carbamoyltransferase HypF [Blastocatellia bacterium]